MFDDYGNDWEAYDRVLNHVFQSEIVHGDLNFQDLPVKCRRYPESKGRWASYWHLVQSGKQEEDRVPDLKRCERLRWIPWVIEYAIEISEIDVWQNVRGQQINTLLWYVEEYLVVLGKRSGYWLLKTAYCTENQRRIYKLRIERDLFLKTKSIDGSK